ncbi:MAG: dipeptidase [Lautropia sp.]
MIKVFDLLSGALMTPQYIDDALRNGISAVNITVHNFSNINPSPSMSDFLRDFAAVRAHYAGLSGRVRVVESYADFGRADEESKLAVVFGCQNVPEVGKDLKVLELFHGLGVRIMQISHNHRGLYADGCSEPNPGGLSQLGRELVATMNDLRIVVDLSHTGEPSSVEAIELSKYPVAISHANVQGVHMSVRNKSDETLDALKKNRGVIGICYLPPTVRGGDVKPTHDEVAAHVRYVRDRIGIDHVAIGSDFITGQPASRYQQFVSRPEVYGTWPWQYPVTGPEDQQRFLSSLAGSNLSPADIQAVARGNALRVFKAVMG